MGAAIGAALVCTAVLVPVGPIGMRLLASAVPVSMCMLYVTFRIDHRRKLIQGSLVMACCGFFLGSVMIWILNRLRTVLKEHMSLLATLLAGYVSYSIMRKILRMLKRRKDNCLKTVVVYVPESQKEVRIPALLDTGNHLTDPVSGKPVCLIGRKTAEQIASCFKPEKYHVVPFRSVGRDNGILHAYELRELVIEDGGQHIRKEHVIVAVCDTGISEESVYQMILHPRLIED